jgi:hypothetical protein
MLKKAYIACAVTLGAIGTTHACSVMYETATDVAYKAIAESGWGFKNYAQVCKKLNAANASLLITGTTTVLHGVSISWASVSLRDKKLPIVANSYGGRSTIANTTPSMDMATRNLPQAINNAVDSMDLDRAIASLNEMRKIVRIASGK